MKKVFHFMLIILLGVFLLYPVVFIILGSFMSKNEVLRSLKPIISNSNQFVSWPLLSQVPSLQSHVELGFDTPEFFVMFWNSVKVSVVTCVGQLLVASPAAWWLTRCRACVGKAVYWLYVILALTPFAIWMLPQYLVLQNLELLNSLYTLILPGIFSTFPILILHSFFEKVPHSLVEMAQLEGATETYTFIHIGLPLVRGGIAIAILFSFVEQWSLFEQPLLFIGEGDAWTLPLYLTNIGLQQSNLQLAASVFTMVFPILLLCICKEHLENGIAEISLKE